MPLVVEGTNGESGVGVGGATSFAAHADECTDGARFDGSSVQASLVKPTRNCGRGGMAARHFCSTFTRRCRNQRAKQLV